MRPPDPPDPDEGYFPSIEAHFTRLRGEPLILSPRDWQLAAEWQRRGIALKTVLRALDTVFQTAAARGRRGPVLSLAYCRHAVEAEHARALSVAAGSDLPAPDEEPAAERVSALAATLEQNAREWAAGARRAARHAAEEMRRLAVSLASGGSAESAEEQLIALERILLDDLLASLSPEERAGIDRRCEKLLGEHRQRMDPGSWKKTLRHARDRELRERLRVPRLSLLPH